MKHALRMVAWFSLIAVSITAAADEIGFVEEFALAKDRTKAMEKLIPGTREYFYYHCLHYQNTQDFDKVEEILVPWIKRYGYTARVYEIKNRQALLTFDKNPQKFLGKVKGFKKTTAKVAANKKCPVTGKPVVAKAVTPFRGQLIGFCCNKCKAAFVKNPGKHLSKLASLFPKKK